MIFFVSLFFIKINIFINSIRNTIKLSNSLETNQAGCYVRPVLGTSILQRFSADNKRCQ